jgi:WD40 repeat protein
MCPLFTNKPSISFLFRGTFPSFPPLPPPPISSFDDPSQVDFGMWTPEQKQVVKEKVQSKILCAAWSSDGTILALGMLNGWISIRNVNSDELHHIERRAPIWSLQFIPGTSGSSGGGQKTTNSTGNASPSGNAGSQDSDLLVVGCWDKTLSLYR